MTPARLSPIRAIMLLLALPDTPASACAVTLDEYVELATEL